MLRFKIQSSDADKLHTGLREQLNFEFGKTPVGHLSDRQLYMGSAFYIGCVKFLLRRLGQNAERKAPKVSN